MKGYWKLRRSSSDPESPEVVKFKHVEFPQNIVFFCRKNVSERDIGGTTEKVNANWVESDCY